MLFLRQHFNVGASRQILTWRAENPPLRAWVGLAGSSYVPGRRLSARGRPSAQLPHSSARCPRLTARCWRRPGTYCLARCTAKHHVNTYKENKHVCENSAFGVSNIVCIICFSTNRRILLFHNRCSGNVQRTPSQSFTLLKVCVRQRCI